MNPKLALLMSLVERRRLLPKAIHDRTRIPEVLNGRDQGDFDAHWMRVYNAIEAVSGNMDRGEEGQIRKAVFIQVFQLTDDDDLAGYMSDDFGLFASALAVGFEDGWLNALFNCYCRGEIPHGDVRPVSGSLSSMVESADRERGG